jgi:hypothetical protein
MNGIRSLGSGSVDEPEAPGRYSSARRIFWLWAGLTVTALILRVALLPLGPRYGYQWDHDDMVRWGIQATDAGLLTLYDVPAARWDMLVWSRDRWVVKQRTVDRRFVYPPLTAYLTYAMGFVFAKVGEDRLINTVTSRAVFAAFSFLADFLLAWACAALVACYKPGRPAMVTYALLLFLPMFWWDSVGWGQIDTVMLAPAVWMMWAMVRARWLLAGILFGMTAMLKPQAVLFLPVWALAFVVARPVWRPLLSLVLATAVASVMALPFMLHSGFEWLRVSYLHNLLAAFPATTLKAFNLWYADLLICGSRDASASWLGVAKDWWGRGLVCLALAGGFAWFVTRWRREPRGLILWAGVSLLACVMLPTRVHERYILGALPFLIVAAMLWRRLWPGVVMLLVVATAQLAWPIWLQAPPGGWANEKAKAVARYEARIATLPPDRRADAPDLAEYVRRARQRHFSRHADTIALEWGLVALALAGSAATAAAVVSLRARHDSGRNRGSQGLGLAGGIPSRQDTGHD